MGLIYYEELPDPKQPDVIPADVSIFDNVQSGRYWFSEAGYDNPDDNAWWFNLIWAAQDEHPKTDTYAVWAVADGYVECPIVITIDIKPGSDPNCFNINGHGVIPLAIHGTEDFDVTEIDLATLSFGGLEVRMRGNKGPLCAVDYSNDDVYLDLICHFEDNSDMWTPGDGEATLTGNLLDGTSIEGSDSICIVP